MNFVTSIKNLVGQKSRYKNLKGFTLVELIIYMGILVMLLTVLTTIFTQAVDTQLESQASSSVEQDGRYIISKLLYDINRASSITSPALGVTSSSLQIVISGVTYTYASSSGNLVLTNNNGANNLNGFDTTLSQLSFQIVGNSGGKNTITVQFRLTTQTIRPRCGQEVRAFTNTAGMRY